MYHENHKINDIVLTVINDGNGSQCGMDYGQRCTAASKSEYGVYQYEKACKQYMPTATPGELESAARLLQAYYLEHMAEMGV